MAETLLDARTAAERLKISRATLYSYVSRGLIRTQPHPDDPRARLYPAADIEAFNRRKSVQHRPAEAAAATLDWGLPALETGISSIADGRLAYRGRDAIAFADQATFEEATALLWRHEGLAEARFEAGTVPMWAETSAGLAVALDLVRAQALLPLMGNPEPLAHTSAKLAVRGGVLVEALATAIVPGLDLNLPMHEALAAAWMAPRAADAIRRALVLIADHEMNASTFAVRVVASTGAGLTSCLCAGLAALSGPLHGGATLRVAAMMAEIREAPSPGAAITNRLARGDDLPGFGHRLYPDGDPRAAALFTAFDAPRETAIADAIETETGLRPNIDFALVALQNAFDLPAQAAIDLFTIGRSAGWVAHAIEQRETGRLIRPRARFVGSHES